MISAIDQYLVPLGVSISRVSLEGKDVYGGYFIWFELPKGLSAECVATRAKVKENLIVAHGNLFEVYGDEEAVRFYRWLRLCFAWEKEEMLVEGIQRLGKVIRNMPEVENNEEIKEPTAESLRTPMGGY
jgi:hypothetical protein